MLNRGDYIGSAKNAAAHSLKGGQSAGPVRKALHALLLAAWIAVPLIAQDNGAAQTVGNNAPPKISLPQDWTHAHLVFSGPNSFQNAADIQKDPRFWQQFFKRNLPPRSLSNAGLEKYLAAPDGNAVTPEATGEADAEAGGAAHVTALEPGPWMPPRMPSRGRIQAIGRPDGDWSVSLGGSAAAAISLASFPAKFTLDINAAPSCTDDFVLFPLAVAASSTQPSVVGINQLYSGPTTTATVIGTFSSNSTTGTVTIKNGSNTLTLTPVGSGSNACTSSTAGTFVDATSTTTAATNLAAAINSCHGSPALLGATATSSANLVTVTASTAGSAGNAITVGGTLTGFAWGGSSLAGGSDAGTCGSGGPTVVWAYDTHTGTGGNVYLSPVVSLDGTKVAYVESISGGSVLHVLHPKRDGSGHPATQGTVAAPVVPDHVITSGTCTNPTTDSCDFKLTYTTAANGSSAPYYDYSTDSLYVGDAAGTLWKIINVFTGTPAKATGAWASGISIGTAASLNSPIFDYATKNIYTGDRAGGMDYWRDTGSTAGACTAPCFGGRVTGYFDSVSEGMDDPPIMDSSKAKIMFFGRAPTTQAPVVVQVSTTLTGAVTATLGSANASFQQTRIGAFDNTYYTGGGTGNLYVCGVGATAIPTLYRIPFSAGVMPSGTPGSSLAVGTTAGTNLAPRECSPLAEIYNTSKDWLFVGVQGNCAFGGDSGGCVESFDITSGLPTIPQATGAESGGTSGIVVDNVSALGHASSLYFSTLGVASCTGGSAGGCAVQRTQGGVQ
ncbi:MAG: hypothetical protein ABSC23_05675 [Bryobacteraceae bacterium]|jgi:hypothetical protein